MAQDAAPQDTQDEERKRRSAWPWIALAIVILVVILLLWLFWRQPEESGKVTVTKTTVVPITLPATRPEPVVPTSGVAPSRESSSPLVPDVVGNPQSRAVTALESAGYTVDASYVFSASKASGLVQSQTPSGGTPAEFGSTVSITVLTGTPATIEVTMPSVVGLTQKEAEDKVRAAGLVPYVTYGASAKFRGRRCMSQWPLAGESLPKGSEGFIQVTLH